MQKLLILFIILSVIFLIGMIVLIVLLKRVRKASIINVNEFDLANEATACKVTSGEYCLCNDSSSLKNICFSDTAITIPSIHKTIPIPTYSTLTTDENNPVTTTIQDVEVGLFKFPFTDASSGDIICLRNMTNANVPQRLCYNMTNHQTFLSGPTAFTYVQLNNNS